MLDLLKNVAMIICITGMLIDLVGMASLAFYWLRKRLAWHPFNIISFGGVLFFTGVLLLIVLQCFS